MSARDRLPRAAHAAIRRWAIDFARIEPPTTQRVESLVWCLRDAGFLIVPQSDETKAVWEQMLAALASKDASMGPWLLDEEGAP